MKFLIFFEQKYLIDYFLYIAKFLYKQKIDITIATPFNLKVKLKTLSLTKYDLINLSGFDCIWLTADAIDYANNNASIIYTQQHAGFGEFEFIPNVRILKKVDFLFCATANFKNIKQDDFKNLLLNCKNSALNIIPIGYPKIDYISSLKKINQDSIVISLTSMSEHVFNVKELLNFILIYLLNNTNYRIVLRPCPCDINKEIIQNISYKYSNEKRFYLSTKSYIPEFRRSICMFMIGRNTATTAYTYAYSFSKGVIFINDTKTKNNIDECDIGFIVNMQEIMMGGGMANLLELITQKSVLKRIEKSANENLMYKNKSLQRISDVFNGICNKDIKSLQNTYSFYRDAKLFDPKKAFLKLINLRNKVSISSNQNLSEYAFADYLQIYIKQSNIDDELASYIIKYLNIRSEVFKADLALNILDALSSKKPYLATTIFKTAYKFFISLINPSDNCLNFFISISANTNSNIDHLLNNKILDNKNLAFSLSRYFENNNMNLLSMKYAYVYVKTFFPYDIELFFNKLKSDYAIYGNGEILKNLIKYIIYCKKTLPIILLHKDFKNSDKLYNIPCCDIENFDTSLPVFIISKNSFLSIKYMLISQSDFKILNEEIFCE